MISETLDPREFNDVSQIADPQRLAEKTIRRAQYRRPVIDVLGPPDARTFLPYETSDAAYDTLRANSILPEASKDLLGKVIDLARRNWPNESDVIQRRREEAKQMRRAA